MTIIIKNKMNIFNNLFILYFLEDSIDNWRTIITKGNNIQ